MGEVGLLQYWSAGSGRGTPLQKQERRGVGEGFARGRSDAQVNFFLREKRNCLEGEGCVCSRMSMRTFHRWGGLVFIVDVLPVGW